jgi:hypothetical protein
LVDRKDAIFQSNAAGVDLLPCYGDIPFCGVFEYFAALNFIEFAVI